MSTASLTFTSGNWNVAQEITVSAVDDRVAEGAHTGSITHTAASSDPRYGGIAVVGISANITDNDAAGVTVTESGGTALTEGGATDTYTVVLNSRPTAAVTISIGVDAQVSADKASLTFAPANWDTPQTVTVSAVDDCVAEGAHTGLISHAAFSPDANYDGIAGAGIAAGVTDNDTAGVIITQSGSSTEVSEGGVTDTYTLALASRPAADVTISVSPDAQLTASPVSPHPLVRATGTARKA